MTDYGHRLTLKQAIDDAGWIYTLFAAAVSAPSLLSLLQMIFVEHRLVDALQWIVDGYNDIVGVLGSVFEPLLEPLIAWVNAVFDWRLDLQPHWKPLFLLAMVRVSASARINLRPPGNTFNPRPPINIYDTFVSVPLLAIATLAGVVAAASVPIDGNWQAQGAMTAILVATMRAAMAVLGAISELINMRRISPRFFASIADAVAFTLIAYLLGAGFSFIPGVASGAGIIAFAVMLLAEGALSLSVGLGNFSLYGTRLGLIVLGGFLVAALILVADVAIRVLSA